MSESDKETWHIVLKRDSQSATDKRPEEIRTSGLLRF